MKLENILQSRNWAESLQADSKATNDCKSYYYFQNWIERFDRILNSCTCYPEHRSEYIQGMKELSNMAVRL